LRAVIHRLIEKDDALQELLNLLDSELDTCFSWATANRVELALVDYYDGVTLLTEWRRRQADVVSLPSHLSVFYKEQQQETDVSALRVLMSRLVTDLQWVVESKRVVRFNESRMRRNVVALFCARLFYFLLQPLHVYFLVRNSKIYASITSLPLRQRVFWALCLASLPLFSRVLEPPLLNKCER
jgi:hypothetical protein